MRSSPPLRALLVALLAVVFGGCSLVFVRGPDPEAGSDKRPACTRSRVAPIADLAVGGPPAGSGLILGILCVSSGSCDEHPEALGVSLLALAVGVPLFVSGVIGFGRVDRCSDAHLRHEIWRRENEKRDAAPGRTTP